MTKVGWDDLYAEVQNGVTGVDDGTYRLRVDAVRMKASSRLLFLDLEIQSGPLTGKLAQVNLYLPKPGDRNAGFHFRNKIAGFGDLSATFAAMAAADPDGSNVEGALEILAAAIVNQVVDGTLKLRGEDAGQYAGTNELESTKPVDGAAPAAPAAVPAAPVAAPVAPAPVAAAPVAPTTEAVAAGSDVSF